MKKRSQNLNKININQKGSPQDNNKQLLKMNLI